MLETTSYNKEYLIENKEKFIAEARKLLKCNEVASRIESEITSNYQEKYHLIMWRMKE